ncbi:MAG TPA: hypothetical protein PK006_01375 [Saprospiraceae bacterium]|nr:hypothetical protein [Saprospiraceae bacterium]
MDTEKQKKENFFHYKVIVSQYNYIVNQHFKIYNDAFKLYFNAGQNLIYLLEDNIKELEDFVFPYDRYKELERIQGSRVRSNGGK